MNTQGQNQYCPHCGILNLINMGRYYSGDIKGKFAFGIQASNDASYFGGQEPQIISYAFEIEDLDSIEEGIATCKKQLGKYKKLLDKYININDIVLAKKLKISKDKLKELLEIYYRLDLGEKIFKCVKEKGRCYFDAEL